MTVRRGGPAARPTLDVLRLAERDSLSSTDRRARLGRAVVAADCEISRLTSGHRKRPAKACLAQHELPLGAF